MKAPTPHDTHPLRLAIGNRHLGRAHNVEWTYGRFCARLTEPKHDDVPLTAYLAMEKAEQDTLKNVGWFVGGHYKDRRRRGIDMVARSLITLDLDELTRDQLVRLQTGISGLRDIEFTAYSTRKHTPDMPRLRVVIPLETPIPPERYEAVARILASRIGPDVQSSMDAADDKASFQANQLMYWPSVCQDGEHFVFRNPGRLVNPDRLLAEFVGDWRDHAQLPRSDKRAARRASDPHRKAQDPRGKPGVIGAFCRAYGIEDAIAEFLPEVYAPSEGPGADVRYTYVGGSTANGAVVYDDLWLYSHHATDPVSEQLVNAFDLVRIHKFGELDAAVAEDARPTELPSFAAMEALAKGRPEVVAELETGFDDLDAAGVEAVKGFTLTYWRRPDPAAIDPREWLYGTAYARRYLGATVAAGGVGKTSLLIAEALAMVTGRPLLGDDKPFAPLRVGFVNLEDPLDELERRFAATEIYYDLRDDPELQDRLVLNGRGTELVIASEGKNGLVVHEPVVKRVIEQIGDCRLDVFGLDPFVSSHNVSENDNMKIDRIAKKWGDIAEATNCAIHLSHHIRKPGRGAVGEVTVDDARGAGALVNAARMARVLNPMKAEEAKKLRVSEHWRYIRIDDGKRNLAPPPDKAKWCKLVSIGLGNFRPENGREQDYVGVVTGWTPPAPSRDLTHDSVETILNRVAEGEWQKHANAKQWVGNLIADVLNWDPKVPEAREQLKAISEEFFTKGWFVPDKRPGLDRHLAMFVAVGRRPADDETFWDANSLPDQDDG
jgi:hypothetical protein